LEQVATEYRVGPLNQSPRKIPVGNPLAMNVRDICATCNNGWMSELEMDAKRVLTPAILGEPTIIAANDQAIVAAWGHKTALVNMRVSSEDQRGKGYGLPVSEYFDVFNMRASKTPPAKTQFWIGRYTGRRLRIGVCVTPMEVKVLGLPDSGMPHAYVMTIVVGELLLQGIRFTTPGLDPEVSPMEGFTRIWPATGKPMEWPSNSSVNHDKLLRIQKGLNFTRKHPRVHIEPWKVATDLPNSIQFGSRVALPTPCGKHYICYPGILAREGQQGKVSCFIASCECGKAYFVRTETDGAHFLAEGDFDSINAKYAALPWEELGIQDENGKFFFKQCHDKKR
jgi:hypothetical protein